MHELSIALSIIEVAEEELQRLGAGRVHSIHLRVGAISGVGRQSLTSAFELAKENTACFEAELLFEEMEVLALCPTCDQARPITSLQNFTCAACGSPVSEVVQGRELQVAAMEVE